MKEKLLIFIMLVAVALTSTAQTQQGYVKTRGRLVNGHVVAGQRLSGATVQVKGRNAVVSKANGTFSFPVSANRFVVQSVKKQGYVLVDPEVTARQYSYSSDPLIFVLETPSQLTEDKLANERKIRRTLQRQLQAKEDEIEALKEQNRITEEEYHKAYQKLYAQQKSNEKLISEMVERYSQIDYDQLDKFNQRISDCILNGRLTEADSLLRSKGDMKSRIAAILQEEEIEAAEAAELAQRQENLEKSKAGTKASKEDVARDCYSFYERFLTEHQNDSAAYYLELRASLDTTNIEWLNQAGTFIVEYLGDYRLALEYYQRGLSLAKNKDNNEDLLVSLYNNVGVTYYNMAKFEQALDYYQRALAIRERVLEKNHPLIATYYSNIGVVYSSQGDYERALDYLQKALELDEMVYGANHPKVVAQDYNNIGLIYEQKEDYAKALEYCQKALAIREQVSDADSLDLALSYNSIGSILDDQRNTTQALEYYIEALDIRVRVLGESHPDVANSYNNIGHIFLIQGDYSSALKNFLKALEISENALGKNHPSTALSYSNIGVTYDEQGNKEQALQYYQKALISFENSIGLQNPQAAKTYINIGAVYFAQGNYNLALEYYKKLLEMPERFLGSFANSVKTRYDICLYYHAIELGNITDFFSEHCFISTVNDGDTPARQQGMTGDYILLEFADWTEISPISFFDKNNELRGKPKDIVVLKDGIITKHHFENTIGTQTVVKHITKEERQHINQLYNQWKRENRE